MIQMIISGKPAQIASEVAVACVDTPQPAGHVLTFMHLRSLVRLGATVWNCSGGCCSCA